MLTAAKIRSGAVRAAHQVADGGGLHLYVAPTGLKSSGWRSVQGALADARVQQGGRNLAAGSARRGDRCGADQAQKVLGLF